MRLLLARLFATRTWTIGNLFAINSKGTAWLCSTLEPPWHVAKIVGNTRIPRGEYELKLRDFGEHHESYKDRFPGLHKGVIEISNVPQFVGVLMHVGNYPHDTQGCVLVGNMPNCIDGSLVDSVAAYKRMYRTVAKSIIEQPHVMIEIRNEKY